jgi:hypothetical protein
MQKVYCRTSLHYNTTSGNKPIITKGILLELCTGRYEGFGKIKVLKGKNCKKGDILYFNLAYVSVKGKGEDEED